MVVLLGARVHAQHLHADDSSTNGSVAIIGRLLELADELVGGIDIAATSRRACGARAAGFVGVGAANLSISWWLACGAREHVELRPSTSLERLLLLLRPAIVRVDASVVALVAMSVAAAAAIVVAVAVTLIVITIAFSSFSGVVIAMGVGIFSDGAADGIVATAVVAIVTVVVAARLLLLLLRGLVEGGVVIVVVISVNRLPVLVLELKQMFTRVTKSYWSTKVEMPIGLNALVLVVLVEPAHPGRRLAKVVVLHPAAVGDTLEDDIVPVLGGDFFSLLHGVEDARCRVVEQVEQMVVIRLLPGSESIK
jgi:hypothetical protein